MITVAAEYRPAEVRPGFKVVLRCLRSECQYGAGQVHSYHAVTYPESVVYQPGSWTVVQPDCDREGLPIQWLGPLCVFDRVGDALRYLLALGTDTPLWSTYSSVDDVIARLKLFALASRVVLCPIEYEPSAERRVWTPLASTPLTRLPAGTRLAQAVRVSDPLALTDESVVTAALAEWRTAQPTAAR